MNGVNWLSQCCFANGLPDSVNAYEHCTAHFLLLELFPTGIAENLASYWGRRL